MPLMCLARRLSFAISLWMADHRRVSMLPRVRRLSWKIPDYGDAVSGSLLKMAGMWLPKIYGSSVTTSASLLGADPQRLVQGRLSRMIRFLFIIERKSTSRAEGWWLWIDKKIPQPPPPRGGGAATA